MNKDPYKYHNINVLKNKLNIKDAEKLNRFERDITVKRLAEVDQAISGEFNYERLLKIHRHIFEPIYKWAGCERTIAMAKSEPVLGGDTVRYSLPDRIRTDATKVINTMNKTEWNTLDNHEKALKFSMQIAQLWKVHPFREGNTRTVITFATQFADTHGFPMNKKVFRRRPDYVRDALVKACDGMYAEPHYLANVFEYAITGKTLNKPQMKHQEKEYEYER